MTLYGKALGVSWWMECLGRSHGQNPRGLRPLGFLPWGLPRHSIHHDTPSAFPNNVPIYGKIEELVWWMESLGSFPRVLNVLPREKIEGPPRDFLKANQRPHPRPDQRPKTQGAAGPEGGLAFGLAKDLGKGLPFEDPEGGLQYASEGVRWVLKGHPEGSIHHDTSEAFQQILIIFT